MLISKFWQLKSILIELVQCELMRWTKVNFYPDFTLNCRGESFFFLLLSFAFVIFLCVRNSQRKSTNDLYVNRCNGCQQTNSLQWFPHSPAQELVWKRESIEHGAHWMHSEHNIASLDVIPFLDVTKWPNRSERYHLLHKFNQFIHEQCA